MSPRSAAITWSKRGVFLTGWAIIGIALWIPRIVGAAILYACALVQAALRGTSARPAGEHLRRAADFYRSFVDAMDSIRAPAGAEPVESRPWPRPLLRELAWAALVWYVILAPVGVVEPTPVDVASSLATAPWAEMWSGAVEAVTSIPALFRG